MVWVGTCATMWNGWWLSVAKLLLLLGVHSLQDGQSLLVVAFSECLQLLVHVSVQCNHVLLELWLSQCLQLQWWNTHSVYVQLEPHSQTSSLPMHKRLGMRLVYSLMVVKETILASYPGQSVPWSSWPSNWAATCTIQCRRLEVVDGVFRGYFLVVKVVD